MSNNKFLCFATKLIVSKIIMLFSCSVLSGVQITGTRVILPEDKKEVAVAMRNSGNDPVVMQLWIDKPSKNTTTTEDEDPSLIVSPPLVRLNPGDRTIVRVRRVGGIFPLDRESFLQFNAKEIPVESKLENSLQFAFTTVLKLFVRPANLNSNVHDAPSQIKWTISKKDKNLVLTANNPTPYFITISSLKINDEISVSVNAMVPPLDKQEYLLEANKLTSGQVVKNISFQTINDYGGEIQNKAIPTLN